MKMKKIISSLLAVVMTVGLLPLPAMAAEAGEVLGTVQGGQFVDKTAAPGKSYEYTIRDTVTGESRTVVLDAAVTPSVDTSGNQVVVAEYGPDKIVYNQVDPLSLATTEATTCLLVNESNGAYYAAKADLTGPLVTVSPDGMKIYEEQFGDQTAQYEWSITHKDNDDEEPEYPDVYTFTSAGGKLSMVQKGSSWSPMSDLGCGYDSAGKAKFKLDTGERSGNGAKYFVTFRAGVNWGYLMQSGNVIKGIRGSGSNNAQFWYFYQKGTEHGDPVSYKVDAAGLQAQLTQSDTVNDRGYSPNSWAAFEQARAAAHAALNAEAQKAPYTEKTAADAALAEINRLHRELYTAQVNLVYAVDTEPLETLVQACEAELQEQDYTAASWGVYLERLTAAKTLLQKVQDHGRYVDKTEAETARQELGAAKDVLTAARNGLVPHLVLTAERDDIEITTIQLRWTPRPGVTYTLVRDGAEIIFDEAGAVNDQGVDPNVTHIYELSGSDNSYASAKVLAMADGSVVTGNSVEQVEIADSCVYNRVTDPTKAAGDGYLLVMLGESVQQAIGYDLTGKSVNFTDTTNMQITGERTDLEWTVSHAGETNGHSTIGFQTQVNGKPAALTLQKSGNSYIGVVSTEYSTDVWEIIKTTDGKMHLGRKYEGKLYSLDYNAGSVQGATNIYMPVALYEKVVTTQKTAYRVDHAGLDALLTEADTKLQGDYTHNNWAPFAAAKQAAESARQALETSYPTREAAEAALNSLDEAHRTLKIAMDELTSLRVNTENLEKAMGTANDVRSERYEKDDAWRNYEAAKTQADLQLADKDKIYDNEKARDRAQEATDRATLALTNALANLNPVVNQAFEVPVEWLRRTKEFRYNETDKGNLMTEISQFGSLPDNGGLDFSKLDLTKEWKELLKLPVDDGMTVWDYGTDQQYAAIKETTVLELAGQAATWNDRDADGVLDGDWKTSSARKFSGTFTWPVGFSMDSNAVVYSVNEAAYQPIYEYIEADPLLKERYAGCKVLPINDDMFVMVYAENDPPENWKTEEDVLKHLVFWTGSSGKGRWSSESNRVDDWGRTTPATFNDIPAIPAFNGVYPNLVAEVREDQQIPSDPAYQIKNIPNAKTMMPHTDGWYTLVNPNSIVSKLKEAYPDGLEGQKMHLVILCLDNAGIGGMDQLNLQLTQPPLDAYPVEVEYYLDNVSGQKLGTATLGNFREGNRITLNPGAIAGQLDYMRSKAATVSGKAVTPGRQMGDLSYVVHAGANIIRVVYNRIDPGMQYFTYDFGLENHYSYRIDGTELSNPRILDPKSKKVIAPAGLEVTAAGNSFFITYTPQSSEGQPLEVLLAAQATSDGAQAEVSYGVTMVPASNTLYEENFFTVKQFPNSAEWVQTGTALQGPVLDNGNAVGRAANGGLTPRAVADDAGSAFGYSRIYESSVGVNGAYTATMAPRQLSDDLEFEFMGRGFDLIGSCGPDSGTLIVKVFSTAADQLLKAYVIDTRYSVGELHQVPLLRVALPGGGYQIVVTASNTPEKPTGPVMMGADPLAPYEALLRDMGLTDEELERTEFIRLEDTLEGAAEAAEPARLLSEGQKTMTLDGFRVYRNSVGNYAAYPADECDKEYINILDAAVQGSFTAYVEPKASAGTGEESYTVETYHKSGGPAGEVYLGSGQSISFKLKESTAQISARSVLDPGVDGQTPSLSYSIGQSDVGTIPIPHNTELYYQIKSGQDGVYTIKNTGGAGSLLAIGMVKAQQLEPMNLQDEKRALQATMFMSAPRPELPQGAVESDGFVPEELDIRVNVLPAFGGQMASLVVTASRDVSSLRVNGQEVLPGNSLLVRPGLEDRYVFAVTEQLRPGAQPRFEVQAFDRKGRASDVHMIPKTAEGMQE